MWPSVLYFLLLYVLDMAVNYLWPIMWSVLLIKQLTFTLHIQTWNQLTVIQSKDHSYLLHFENFETVYIMLKVFGISVWLTQK